MLKVQQSLSSQKNRYNEIIEYLKQNNNYWLESDKWDLTMDFFVGEKVYNTRTINFEYFHNEQIKNEFKYYLLYNFKNKIYKINGLRSKFTQFNNVANFLKDSYGEIDSLFDIKNRGEMCKKFYFYLHQLGLKNKYLNTYKDYRYNSVYYNTLTSVYDLIFDFYDERDELEKDLWSYKKIVGSNISATLTFSRISFLNIPSYYREIVKRYLRVFITKKSFSHCYATVSTLNIFFNYFYDNGYEDGFLENLTRNDMEKFFYFHASEYKKVSRNAKATRLFKIRNFLKYIQYAGYDLAPKTAIDFLVFDLDMIKKESNTDTIKRVRFIDEDIIKQIDSNIGELEYKEFIPIYILLRETGWRGADILNLRYDNCLEKTFNKKENRYNTYLCAEITKVGMAQLKVPLRDEVAELVERCILEAKELSTAINNPKKYLFNTYSGQRMGLPIRRPLIVKDIRRLIAKKDIRNQKGELYHFNLHSLRHTRAKEYVEQGVGISIIQQMLGHRSLQMTVHYATVSENVLYEKWKNTEDLELFKVDPETNEVLEIDVTSVAGDNLVRYEYVKKNLDAVRVPFGVCFKASKLPCKQQMNHCLTCASFCTTIENIPEYEEEIEKVKQQIEISNRYGRELWAEKNQQYLNVLEKTLEKVKEHKLVHKNGASREEI